ncbi:MULTISPECIES: ferritin-like domain-containing protein [Pseudofrankia]|uniref:ferritin-like domain-containing protein n=1 Tax=Pseudofrankia TaxID=2994363 RepID=UPI000234B6CC|nr:MULTISPECIES: ferritin-like domain-containing protein [Pseudofrankia]OHV33952.1 rubrerythrin family protein [Pseudofrankia sp. EUN1h]
MSDTVDDRRLRELSEASEDLHSDAMRGSRVAVADLVESTEPATRSVRRGAALAVGLAGAGVLATATRGSAATMDVAILQTAASIENLAVSTYTTALTLPFIGGAEANAVVKAFAMTTMKQHVDHAGAFNAAVVRLGGQAQSAPDPKYAKVVEEAIPTIKGPGDVVSLAITLEDVAAQTYTKNVSQVGSSMLRQLFGSVAAVEAQHRAILLAVSALLGGGAADLIALPPDAAKLPKAAGGVGFPDAFYPTSMASPATEGAVA